MEHTARRQSLREQLGRAREALDRGDPSEALAAVECALQIDPDYLAAQALKERILRQPVRAAAAASVLAEPAFSAPVPVAPPQATGLAAGVGRFEERIRARRIEKRAEAARAALTAGQVQDARAAIDEIAAIDPQHPAHAILQAELEARTAARGRPRRVGLAVAAVLLCAAAIPVWRSMDSRRFSAAPAAVETPAADRPQAALPPTAPAAVEPTAAEPPVDARETLPRPEAVALAATRTPPATQAVQVPTTGRSIAPPPFVPTPGANRTEPLPVGLGSAPATINSVSPVRPEPAPQIAPIEPTDPAQLPGALTALPQEARARTVERPSDAVSASRSIAVAPVTTPRVRDEDMVLRTLQQYRRAYDTLDARAAQAVWPGVDSTALQRAFDGLVSQRLTFRSCQLQVNGATATAACLGTARYTPRMGAREARDEPRDWRFTLRKTPTDEWQIESARVAR